MIQFLFDDFVGCGKGCVNVAGSGLVSEGDVGSELFVNDGRIRAGRSFSVGDDIQRIVINFDQIGCIARFVFVSGDDRRNRLTDKSDFAIGQHWIFRHVQSRQRSRARHIADFASDIGSGVNGDDSG